ncbi:MAG TPA: PEP/pyruvate-binding domain-containing protein [Terriglobales bacterium]|nr:PEP/pyruvate-binding domain-containing protein [Terriglobales bacterium]
MSNPTHWSWHGQDIRDEFRGDFFNPDRRLTSIGSGFIGAKAAGLAFIEGILRSKLPAQGSAPIQVSIPSLTVIRTDVFDAFLQRNALADLAYSEAGNDVIAQAFQKALLPMEILGDLRRLIEKVHTPLAIRSSSMLEDALNHPFAGVYFTKMIPNNQPSPDVRFQKLMEAIKLVYASTFTKSAKDYLKAIRRSPTDEKMAVIIQEVVGLRHADRFYPNVSGIAKSYNFYPVAGSRPEDGMASLALGLGKTIVDGGRCWTYSPAYPSISAPFASAGDLVEQSQSDFWAVNMGKPPAYDPIKETEYLQQLNLSDAEADDTLSHVASVFDAQEERISMGLSRPGPRVLNFAGLLVLNDLPLNDVISSLLRISQEALGAPVEIEFAATFDPHRFGFLQVRPMVVPSEEIAITEEELKAKDVFLASKNVLGNGIIETIRDIVYVKPQEFEVKDTPRIALELETVNRELLDKGRPYVLIGFGRWGSSDSSAGIPVEWGQVCGAKVIVEATGPTLRAELSQGSHFFHNLSSFEVCYFSVPDSGEYSVDWAWLDRQRSEQETRFIRHVVLPTPLQIKVDGRSGRGVIRAPRPG